MLAPPVPTMTLMPMISNNQAVAVTPTYLQAFRGSFTSLLKWPDLDSFWQTLDHKADADWYIYAIGEQVPQTPASPAHLRTFIQEIDKLLRQD